MVNLDVIKKNLLFVLFFTSVDTILFGTNSNISFLYIPRFISALFVFINILIGFKAKILVNFQNLLFILLLSLMFVSALYNKETFGTMFSRILSLITGFTIAKYYKKNDFIDIFCNMMYLVSVIAIILEVCFYLIPSLINIIPIITNTAGKLFKVFFFGSLELNQNGFCRAGGIFWEPGAFATYLNISIFFELFQKETIDKKKMIVYLLALFITVSTTGYISVFVLLLLYVLFAGEFKSNSLKNSLSIFLILAILITVILSNSYIFDSLFGKLINKTSTTNVRISGIIGGFQIAKEYPFFGVFSSKISDLMRYYQPKSGGMLTNTIVYQFASYGMIFGSLYVLGCFRQFFTKNRKLLLSLGLCVFFVFIFVSENFYSFIPYILPFYDLEKNRK